MRPRRGPAAGVAHHAGKVADDKHRLMSEILKLAQLAKDDGMTQMNVGASGVDAEFDAQWPTESEFLAQLVLADYLRSALFEKGKGFVRLHDLTEYGTGAECAIYSCSVTRGPAQSSLVDSCGRATSGSCPFPGKAGSQRNCYSLPAYGRRAVRPRRGLWELSTYFVGPSISTRGENCRCRSYRTSRSETLSRRNSRCSSKTCSSVFAPYRTCRPGRAY